MFLIEPLADPVIAALQRWFRKAIGRDRLEFLGFVAGEMFDGERPDERNRLELAMLDAIRNARFAADERRAEWVREGLAQQAIRRAAAAFPRGY